MNIQTRILDLEARITATRLRIMADARQEAEGKDGVAKRELGRLAAEQIQRETADWVVEFNALKAPIISIIETKDGRVLLATAAAAFELRGDKLVLLAFERVVPQ